MTTRSSTQSRGLFSVFCERIKTRRKYLARRLARRSLRLQFEQLEDRRLLAVSLSGGGTWVEQGPGAIFNGQVEGITNQPVVGAVQAVAVNEAQRIIYAGTVNGGVWVASADGFDESRNNIVMLLARFVVQSHVLLHMF